MQQTRHRDLLLPLGAVVFCLFLWPALITFDPGDWPSPHRFPHHIPAANLCGYVGAWFAYYLRYLLGDGAYPLLLFATLAAIMKLLRGRISNPGERVAGMLVFVVCSSATFHLMRSSGGLMPVGPGGLIGFALGELLDKNLQNMGTFIVLLAMLFVGLLFATEGWVLKLPLAMKRVAELSAGAVAIARAAVGDDSLALEVPEQAGKRTRARSPRTDSHFDDELGDADDEPATTTRARRGKSKTKSRRGGRRKKDDEGATLFDDADAEAQAAIGEEEEYEYVYEDENGNLIDGEWEYEEVDEEDDDLAGEVDDGESAADKNAPTAKSTAPTRSKGPVVNILRSPGKTAPAAPYPKQIDNWVFPSIDLLQEPEYTFNAKQEAFVREQATTLERTLAEFRLDARVVEIDTGPVITMFELALGKGIKVSQIASLSNDIARALKAPSIRVVAPIPGKNTVGIEVPNIEKEKVRLKELMTVAGKKASGMQLPLFLGKDASGCALVADLTKMPHCLIAGTTGSGKSVCINSIIVSVLMTKQPDQVKMILVDPKMVEMSQFKEVPHLMCPIVTDTSRAEKILEWAVVKMDERYEQLAEARVRNIAEYNNLGKEKLFERLKPSTHDERASINIRLPYIVIVIDELADLMMTSAKEVEHHLSRLAQKSRAVGIHIIVATQRPEAKVVTGLIKSNLPSRISFRVASRMDSRIVLDQNGGELLMGQGDMLFLPPGAHKLMRAQGTFLEDEEINAVLDDLCDRGKPEFHPELMKIKSADADPSSLVRDPLFEQAVKVVLETKRGSVSLLQRRLTIGYSRASRLVDQMAEAGIVGEYKGSQAREVVMTSDEWAALQAQVAADMESNYAADQEDGLLGGTTDYGDPLSSDTDDDDGGAAATGESQSAPEGAATTSAPSQTSQQEMAPPAQNDSSESATVIDKRTESDGAATEHETQADADEADDEEEYEYEYVYEDDVDGESDEDVEYEYEYVDEDEDEEVPNGRE